MVGGSSADPMKICWAHAPEMTAPPAEEQHLSHKRAEWQCVAAQDVSNTIHISKSLRMPSVHIHAHAQSGYVWSLSLGLQRLHSRGSSELHPCMPQHLDPDQTSKRSQNKRVIRIHLSMPPRTLSRSAHRLVDQHLPALLMIWTCYTDKHIRTDVHVVEDIQHE